MRPRPILAFEGLMFGTLALSWLYYGLTWNRQLLRLAPITGQALPLLAAMIAITSALFVVLTLLVSRRRSRIAAGVLIALFAFSIPTFVRTFTQGASSGYTLLAEVQTVSRFVAFVLLFLPSSRAWFRRDDEKPDLRATFS
jgi:hypothetical protein